MSIIQWKPELSVGVRELDKQHQKIVCLINDMLMAMSTGRAKQAMGPMLQGLKAYSVEHFAAEEHLMEAQEYPGLAAHKAAHGKFIQKVLDYEKAIAANSTAKANLDVMNFLITWVAGHIQEMDKGYGPHLNERGVR